MRICRTGTQPHGSNANVLYYDYEQIRLNQTTRDRRIQSELHDILFTHFEFYSNCDIGRISNDGCSKKFRLENSKSEKNSTCGVTLYWIIEGKNFDYNLTHAIFRVMRIRSRWSYLYFTITPPTNYYI